MRGLWRGIARGLLRVSTVLVVVVPALWVRSLSIRDVVCLRHDRLYSIASDNGVLCLQVRSTWDCLADGSDARLRTRQVWVESGLDPGPSLNYLWEPSPAAGRTGLARRRVEDLLVHAESRMRRHLEGQVIATHPLVQTQDVCVQVPLWVVGAVAVSGPAGWLRRAWREMRRRARGLCSGCGYDLRASADRCPECGSTIERNRPPGRQATRKVMVTLAVGTVLMLLCDRTAAPVEMAAWEVESADDAHRFMASRFRKGRYLYVYVERARGNFALEGNSRELFEALVRRLGVVTITIVPWIEDVEREKEITVYSARTLKELDWDLGLRRATLDGEGFAAGLRQVVERAARQNADIVVVGDQFFRHIDPGDGEALRRASRKCIVHVLAIEDGTPPVNPADYVSGWAVLVNDTDARAYVGNIKIEY